MISSDVVVVAQVIIVLLLILLVNRRENITTINHVIHILGRGRVKQKIRVDVQVGRDRGLGSLRTADGELPQHEGELIGVALDLVLEVADDAVATADGIESTHIGLVYDGFHGFGMLVGIEVADDFEDIADAEQAVGVEELVLLVGRKVRGEAAVGVALAALVFAGGAGLGCGGLGGGGGGGGGGRKAGGGVLAASCFGGSCMGCGASDHDKIEGWGDEGGTGPGPTAPAGLTRSAEEEEEEEEDEYYLFLLFLIPMGSVVCSKRSRAAHRWKCAEEEGMAGSGDRLEGRPFLRDTS
ncbi:hypothetical protein B296_00016981 [Ensete ventricosum]|uniref:Uncharacterized protein n=1 Tax=Ensete ventricosum TaxID=4639 RepID=A0A427AK94_ENSVE|nr:hypothetical protein B296_00016981 [Ensete ventricosum]